MSGTMTPPMPAPQQGAPMPWRVTREEYYRLGELGFFDDKRVERIHGEIRVMSPIGHKHSVAKGLTADTLRDAFGRSYFIREQDPFQAVDSDPQPDIVVLPGGHRDYNSDHPSRATLIVEIADTSLAYDIGEKSEIYAAAGVEDYWVVDLIHRKVVVFRNPDIGVVSSSGWGYTSRTEYSEGQSIAPLANPALSIFVLDLLP